MWQITMSFFIIFGEQHAPKTSLLPTRLVIFRFLYGERVSEVWEGGASLDVLHLIKVKKQLIDDAARQHLTHLFDYKS